MGIKRETAIALQVCTRRILDRKKSAPGKVGLLPLLLLL